jgi:predicted metal-dependent hydrolase
MESPLRAGVAVYNAGRHHAAHDAWEDHWLDLERGSDDERLLHGLIQFTAAVHHARGRNWKGATGLAASAREYLADLPAEYRDVNVGDVREYLAVLAADPAVIERRRPPALRVEGQALALADLDVDAALLAAQILAADLDVYDETVVSRAVEYAREDLTAGEEASKFLTFLLDFVRDAENRGIIYQRLDQHVERRRSKQRDVEGLFDE